MQVYPTTGKLRLARATPYFNDIDAGTWGSGVIIISVSPLSP